MSEVIRELEFNEGTQKAVNTAPALPSLRTLKEYERRLLEMKMSPEGKLQQSLLHAIAMERKAATRVKRASTLLHKWQAARRRIEKRIGQAEVQRIVNRLSMGVTDHETI